MRRAPPIAGIRDRIGAGLDGDETVAALSIGDRTPGADEIRIERRVAPVHRMAVFAGGVRLPGFHQDARKRARILVADLACEDHQLPERLAACCQVRFLRRHALA